MGEVLRGYDDRLDRPVALKRIRPGRDPATARRRFRREARAAARLSHQAIVQVYDWVAADDDDWLVMELVEGRSLDHLLADGPLDPDHARRIARQIAEGLAVAHAAGLVHRDLKPANIMVTARAEVKILDFGIVKEIGPDIQAVDQRSTRGTDGTSLTLTGQVVGTASAMSPEQALGWPVDHRSDLFSLGILLYEMLTGSLPFEGTSVIDTLSRLCHVRETPIAELNPDVPDKLAGLVGRLLEKDPARRPSDAHSVVTALTPTSEATTQSAIATASTASTVEALTDAEPTLEPSHTAAAAKSTVAESTAEESAPARSRVGPRQLAAFAGAVAVTALVAWLLARAPGSREIARVERDMPQAESALESPREDESSVPLRAAARRETVRSALEQLERFDRPGHIDAAIRDLERATDAEPPSAPALAALARAYWLDAIAGSLDRARLEQARRSAERAVTHGEYLATTYVHRGLVRIELGALDAADQDFAAALELEPLSGEALFGRARLERARGAPDAAERAVLQAIEATPGHWHHLGFLGDLYVETGRYAEAEDAFRRSLELAPDNFMTLRNLGVAHYMQGDLDRAATALQRALEIRQSHTLYANLGTIYFARGLYAQAVDVFEKAIATEVGASSSVLWANLGDAYRWTPGHEPKAHAAFDRALELLAPSLAARPGDGTLGTRRILYLAKSDRCAEVSSELAALAGSLAASNASAWYRLAVSHELCARRDDALRALEQALDAGYAISDVRTDPELLALRGSPEFRRLDGATH